MDPADIEVRNATYRRFVELGRAPTAGEIAEATGATAEDVAAAWHRLHDAHALVLDEHGEIRMANPFSAVPTAFRVEAGGRSWFANCAWDAFGIGAALHVDCRIESSCADCGEPITIDVRDGTPDDTNLSSTSSSRPSRGGRTSASHEGRCCSSGRKTTSIDGSRAGPKAQPSR